MISGKFCSSKRAPVVFAMPGSDFPELPDGIQLLTIEYLPGKNNACALAQVLIPGEIVGHPDVVFIVLAKLYQFDHEAENYSAFYLLLAGDFAHSSVLGKDRWARLREVLIAAYCRLIHEAKQFQSRQGGIQ